jgi:hypothetical protein
MLKKNKVEGSVMWKKTSAIALSSVLLAGVLASSSDAAVATKNVQVKYNNVKVTYNGQLVPTDIEPFLINGTTYIPLRMMAGVFNKNVSWDGKTYTVSVTDKEDTRIASLQAEIAQKDARIAELEKKLQEAEDELAQSDEDDEDDVDDRIDELEDDLNDYYGEYQDLEWSIYLSGDEDSIDVDIEIDLDEYQDEYDDLSDSDIEDLVEDVCSDIWDEFEDADIDGVILDSSDDDELHDFSGDADSGDIEVDGEEI